MRLVTARPEVSSAISTFILAGPQEIRTLVGWAATARVAPDVNKTRTKTKSNFFLIEFTATILLMQRLSKNQQLTSMINTESLKSAPPMRDR